MMNHSAISAASVHIVDSSTIFIAFTSPYIPLTFLICTLYILYNVINMFPVRCRRNELEPDSTPETKNLSYPQPKCGSERFLLDSRPIDATNGRQAPGARYSASSPKREKI